MYISFLEPDPTPNGEKERWDLQDPLQDGRMKLELECTHGVAIPPTRKYRNS